MFAKLQEVIARYKTRKEETENIIMQPENDALREELIDNRQKVTEWLKPIKENWNTIEDVLLWKSPLSACVCFFLISGVFWKFITMKLRKSVLVLGGFLLANGLSGDFRSICWDFLHRNLNLRVKEERSLPFKFDELCLYVASFWLLLARSVRFIKNLNKESPSKYYCFLAVSLFGILTLFTYFPVFEFLYVAVCCFFFYPSLNYLGVMDRLHERIDLLFGRFNRHWQHSKTKRRRNMNMQEKQRYEIADTDDEFLPDSGKLTDEVLASVAPNDENPGRISNQPAHVGDFYASNSDSQGEDEFADSDFAHGLSMPSMSKYDSMMEPYDEFHGGLVFPDHNKSLRNKTYNILEAAANNDDTDEDFDDLPYEDNPDGHGKTQYIPEGPRSGPLSHPSLENELRHRYSHPSDDEYVKSHKIPQENIDYGDNTEADDSRKVIETEFEFLEHTDAEDMNLTDGPGSVSTDAMEEPASSAASGIGSVTNWFGYQ